MSFRSITLSFPSMLAFAALHCLTRASSLPMASFMASPPAEFVLTESAVGMAFDPVAFKKTKHILRAAEFLRDLVAREVVSVEHLPGAVMLADILTKAASRAVFVELIKQLDTFA